MDQGGEKSRLMCREGEQITTKCCQTPMTQAPPLAILPEVLGATLKFHKVTMHLIRNFPFMLNLNRLISCCLKPKGVFNTNIFGSIRSETKLINSFKMIPLCKDKDYISQLRFPSSSPVLGMWLVLDTCLLSDSLEESIYI